jgi:hypothetical protein
LAQPPLAGGLLAAAGAPVFTVGLLADENEQAATTKMSSRLPAISWEHFEFIPVNSFDYFDPPVRLQIGHIYEGCEIRCSLPGTKKISSWSCKDRLLFQQNLRTGL